MALSSLRRLVAAGVPPVLVLAPCLVRVERLAHPAPWLLAVAALVVYATQPTPTRAELAARGDRKSALLIVLSANICTLSPIIEYVARARWSPEPDSLVIVIGGTMLFLGVGLRVWAIRTLASAFTAVVQTTAEQQLVERGPYRWLRHPSYTGVLFSLLGSALAFQSLAGLVTALTLMVPVYVYRIRIEEAALEKHFGEAYRTFAKARWALVPLLW
jgi:protein-S-isoprenylcysteine O-methyltransferase Ste14